MAGAEISSISPFFIVASVDRTKRFYSELGFLVTFAEPPVDPFFAVLCRDGAMLFVKAVGEPAVPNAKRHPSARWDAYLYCPDPDALAKEYSDRGLSFSAPLQDTEDGLRGFEILDPDGYVLFFGRPS